MNLAHLHLLINHFPTIGTILGLGLFIVSLAGKSDDLKRASFAIFFVIALLSLPTYMSGNAAEAAIKGRDGVSEALMVGFGFPRATPPPERAWRQCERMALPRPNFVGSRGK